MLRDVPAGSESLALPKDVLDRYWEGSLPLVKFFYILVVFVVDDVEVFRSVPGRVEENVLMIAVEDDVLTPVVGL
jgi:hypothetical protein